MLCDPERMVDGGNGERGGRDFVIGLRSERTARAGRVRDYLSPSQRRDRDEPRERDLMVRDLDPSDQTRMP